jgi:hypothetical protein
MRQATVRSAPAPQAGLRRRGGQPLDLLGLCERLFVDSPRRLFNAILRLDIYPNYVIACESLFVTMRRKNASDKDISTKRNESYTGNPNSNPRRSIGFNFFRSAQV